MSLLFYALFVLVSTLSKRQDNTYVKVYSNVSEENLKRGLPYKKQAVSNEITIKKLISLLDANCINEIAVY